MSASDQGWEPEEKWEDYDGVDGFNHVRPAWYVKGPEPFGGLRCGDKAQAAATCSMLNSLTGRRPPAPEPREPEAPNPVAVGIAEGMRGLGLTVRVQGDVLTYFTGEEWVYPAMISRASSRSRSNSVARRSVASLA
jgi:hypothetical protein